MTETTTLGRLVTEGRLVLNDGYRTKQSELGRPGIPILRVAEVHDGRIDPALGDHVREEYRSTIGAKVSQPGDVIVTTKGTVGRVAQFRPGMPEFVYSPQLCFFRTRPGSGIDPNFLYQWFRGPEFRRQAIGVQNQTDMAPYINLADLRRMTISLPRIAEQRVIADIVGGLDEKVESNARLVATCRSLARCELLAAPRARVAPIGEISEVRRGIAYTSAGLGHGGVPMVN